jgi:hypothetical protein
MSNPAHSGIFSNGPGLTFLNAWVAPPFCPRPPILFNGMGGNGAGGLYTI